MKQSRYRKAGWFNESARHSLAAKGVKTGSKVVKRRISKILYDPVKRQKDREVITIQIPKAKEHHLKFLKAYTKTPNVGVWKQYVDDNVQFDIEFRDSEDERYGVKLMELLTKLNKKEIKEDLLYARTVPVEESTL